MTELGTNIVLSPKGTSGECTIDRWWTDGDFEYIQFRLADHRIDSFMYVASQNYSYTPDDIRYVLCNFCGRSFDYNRCVEVIAIGEDFTFQLKFVHIFALDKLDEYRPVRAVTQEATQCSPNRNECTEVQPSITYERFFGSIP